MKVADAIAEYLVGFGITHAFGIVGGGNVTLFDAIAKRINIVCCHHEQAAVMAAGAYFRICGQLAPAIVTTGAGSTNALTGVMAAYMDSTPVLVLAGNEASYHLKADTRVLGVQGYKGHWVANHMTKYAEPAWNPKKVLVRLEEAIKYAVAHRQGPVWLDVPKDVQNAELA